MSHSNNSLGLGCDGIVVSMIAFGSDYPSSKPAETFTKINAKEADLGLSKQQLMFGLF